MSLKIQHVTGSNPTTATDQTLDISGFGQPGAAIYVYSRNSAEYDSKTSRSNFSIGFTDGTNQYSSSGVARNNRTTSNSSRRQAEDEVQLRLVATGTGGINAEANFKEWNTDGSTITWGDADTTARYLSAIYFRQNNSDYTANYEVGTFSHNTAADTIINVTGLGASADIVFVSSIQSTSDDTGVTTWIQSIGVYLKGTYQGSVNYYNEDNVSTTVLEGYLSDSRALVEMSGGSVGASLEILDNASGFSVKKYDDATTINCGYLAISSGQDMQLWGGDFVVASLVGTTNVTDIDFALKYLFSLISQVGSLSTLSTTDAAGSLGLGFASGTGETEQVAYGVISDDNAATTDEDGVVSRGIWTGGNNDTSSLLNGTLSAISDSQFSIDWSSSALDAPGLSLAFAVGTSYVDFSAAFSGSGTVTASLNVIIPLAATAFSGAGTFAPIAFLYKDFDLSATAFTGAGTFSGSMEVDSPVLLDAAFSGSGDFDAVLTGIVPIPQAIFSGSGTLSPVLTKIVPIPQAIFSGAGTLSAVFSDIIILSPTAFSATSSFSVGPLVSTIGLNISFIGAGSFAPSMSRYVGLIMPPFTGLGTFNVAPELGFGLTVPYTQYERIQRGLVDAATTGTFYSVVYDAATDRVTVSDTTAAPTSVLAQETNSSFGIPLKNRQTYRFERQEWPWTLKLHFNEPVVIEAFEEALAASPIVLARDTPNGLQQVILEILDSSYEHPPHNQPSTGTRAVIRLLARLSPI